MKTEETGKPKKFISNLQEWDAREMRASAIIMRISFGKDVVVRRW
jgi:hypothetical protein